MTERREKEEVKRRKSDGLEKHLTQKGKSKMFLFVQEYCQNVRTKCPYFIY